MTAQQTRYALMALRQLLASAVAVRADPENAEPDRRDQISHLRWMIQHMEESRAWETDLEKTQRWLGFIQGVLWAQGLCSIDALREQIHNAIAEDGSYDG